MAPLNAAQVGAGTEPPLAGVTRSAGEAATYGIEWVRLLFDRGP